MSEKPEQPDTEGIRLEDPPPPEPKPVADPDVVDAMIVTASHFNPKPIKEGRRKRQKVKKVKKPRQPKKPRETPAISYRVGETFRVLAMIVLVALLIIAVVLSYRGQFEITGTMMGGWMIASFLVFGSNMIWEPKISRVEWIHRLCAPRRYRDHVRRHENPS